MLTRNVLAMIGSVFTIILAPAAVAQEGGGTAPATQPSQPIEGQRANGSLLRGNQSEQRRQRRQAAPTPPTPEENKAAAQAIVTAAGAPCQVTEATLLGVNVEQNSAYEAACAAGPGYILITSTPPQAIDCVVLAGQADLDRSRDPAADVGVQCKLPVNMDVARVVGAYAQEAGIACTVDQGASIGKSSAGNFIYEVGCNGADGFWLEKKPEGWEKTTCLQIITQSAACKFTQPAEQAATVKTMLAGNPASAACDVTEARYMGANANGSFFEAKCAAGNGLIARLDTQQAVQQVYPCAEAARIGGGCKLTTVAAAPEATAPAPAPATN